MVNKKDSQLALGLDLPEKPKKKLKGYYLPESTINFVKAEAKRLSTKTTNISENVVLTAIIDFYFKTTPHKAKRK